MVWIDKDRIALGCWSDSSYAVVVNGDEIVEQPGLQSFGRSHDGQFFALAFADGVEVRQGWDGPRTAWLSWPSGGGFNFATIRQLIVFPDGKRVLLVACWGIFVLTEDGSTLLPLTDDQQDAAEPSRLEMPHGAISPSGDLVLAGCQDSKHLVFNARLERIAQIGPRSDSPHFAWFSADGKVAAFNACNFYSGTSIGVSVTDLPGLETPAYKEHPSVRVLDDAARVYAAVARGDEFIIGDAYGYVRAFDIQGNYRWEYLVGSTIGALDFSPDGRRLAVSTYAGILSVLEFDAAQRDPFAIGTASIRETRRWLFWLGEDRVLRW